jgi:transposase
MGRAGVLQGVRQMRFEGLLERHERGELSQGEAAEMLGMSERTFRRWRDRLRGEGPEGLRDRRIGKPVEPAGGGRGDPAHAGTV